VSAGGHNNVIAPVLAAVIVGVEKIRPHHVFLIQGDSQQGNGVPAYKASRGVCHGNTGGLRVYHRLVAIVVRVITGVEITQERLVLRQQPAGNVHGDMKTPSYPPAVKLRIDPPVGIFAAFHAQLAHGHINAIQVWCHHQGNRIDIQHPTLGQSFHGLPGGDRLSLEMHHHFVIPRGPGNHL